jgi:uncharacterized membrane-anchored protein
VNVREAGALTSSDRGWGEHEQLDVRSDVAVGDATSLNLGYLDSGFLFRIVILIPALAHWQFGLNLIAAFWMSYIVKCPLGASFADYISKPKNTSGINFGDGPTATVFAAAVLVLVTYLALTRPDIQKTSADP